MKGAELIRRIEKLGKTRGVAVSFDKSKGKGSHGRLYYGSAVTTVKDRNKEIGRGLLRDMLMQLGLTKADLDE